MPNQLYIVDVTQHVTHRYIVEADSDEDAKYQVQLHRISVDDQGPWFYCNYGTTAVGITGETDIYELDLEEHVPYQLAEDGTNPWLPEPGPGLSYMNNISGN